MAERKASGTRGMYKRGDVWYSRLTGPDGKTIRKRLSSDKQTAALLLGELRKQVELQRAGILPEAVVTEIKTCEELHLRYLNHIQTMGIAMSSVLAFESGWASVVHKNMFVYLADVTLERVEEWAKRRMADGLRGQTVNLYVGHLAQALRWAHGNGYIRKNPLVNWRSVRKTPSRKRRDFQPEEIRRFFAAETDPELLLRWTVYFNTGFRAAAGRNICWEWIDWERGMLRLPAEANKSRREHWLPMSRTLVEALERRRRLVPDGQAAGPIFSPLTNIQLRRRMQRTCKAAGIDTDGLCLHSIRHTVATTIYNNTDGNLKAVQEVLCHANPATTMRYLHVTDAVKREAIEALNFGVINENSELDQQG